MYPFIPDDHFMRTQMEERLKRSEHARHAHEVRRARRLRSVGPSVEAIAQAAPALREQGMPLREIDAILQADDPEVIRRYLELHWERLEERFADQRRTIGRLVRAVARGA